MAGEDFNVTSRKAPFLVMVRSVASVSSMRSLVDPDAKAEAGNHKESCQGNDCCVFS